MAWELLYNDRCFLHNHSSLTSSSAHPGQLLFPTAFRDCTWRSHHLPLRICLYGLNWAINMIKTLNNNNNNPEESVQLISPRLQPIVKTKHPEKGWFGAQSHFGVVWMKQPVFPFLILTLAAFLPAMFQKVEQARQAMPLERFACWMVVLLQWTPRKCSGKHQAAGGGSL